MCFVLTQQMGMCAVSVGLLSVRKRSFPSPTHSLSLTHTHPHTNTNMAHTGPHCRAVLLHKNERQSDPSWICEFLALDAELALAWDSLLPTVLLTMTLHFMKRPK